VEFDGKERASIAELSQDLPAIWKRRRRQPGKEALLRMAIESLFNWTGLAFRVRLKCKFRWRSESSWPWR